MVESAARPALEMPTGDELEAPQPEVSAPVTPVLEVTGLCKHFPVRKGLLRRTVGHVYAVDGRVPTIRVSVAKPQTGSNRWT